MAFGAGVLISALSFELMDEAYQRGGFDSTAVGFLSGASVYTAANWYLAIQGAKHLGRISMKRESRDSLASIILPLALIFGLVLLLSLPSEQSSREATSGVLESWLKLAIGYLAAIAEIAAAGVIGLAVIRGIVTYLHQLLSRSKQHLDSTEVIRLQLGRVMALGLEFSVASDILRTAVAPNRQDILNLGAIVLLRTLLNYFLEREIRQVELSRSGDRELHQP